MKRRRGEGEGGRVPIRQADIPGAKPRGPRETDVPRGSASLTNRVVEGKGRERLRMRRGFPTDGGLGTGIRRHQSAQGLVPVHTLEQKESLDTKVSESSRCSSAWFIISGKSQKVFFVAFLE